MALVLRSADGGSNPAQLKVRTKTNGLAGTEAATGGAARTQGDAEPRSGALSRLLGAVGLRHHDR